MEKSAAAPVKKRARGAPKNWRDTFIARLGETSNITTAAEAAGISLSHVYKTRREDPGFARRWYAALAEGYDNLEMELLNRLRSDGTGDDAPKAKFDMAVALRCLAVHRESVARERGRRTLAAEVTTIAAINARIDEMRLKQQRNQGAIAKAKAKVAQDTRARG